jgi:cation diffusion facilitator CzcD-associated flavoprotein CzcO
MRQPSITIVGAGFGGIGAAIELRRAGFTDVTVLEKADGVGGVWRENTYPNAACDVPSSLYSWSFAPNPEWPHRYSHQDEILAYIERTAREHGVTDLVRNGVEVASATYDEQRRVWQLLTTDGEAIDTDVLITAVGQLSRPSIPDLPGLGTFTGPAFHSAEWDHSVDLRGKRVAVLGTGASAIQFVPAIAPEVAHLTVFQRSAPWIAPKVNIEYSPVRRKLRRRQRLTQAFGRGLTWQVTDRFQGSFTEGGPLRTAGELLCKGQLRRQVRDPELRAKLRPTDEFGCKRVLWSNEWYPALARPNVSVVTQPVVEVLANGVRGADGAEHEVDVVIYGTGFAATEYLAPMEITGVGGASLQEQWKTGARAYLGLCIPDFPNMFVVYGPYTNLGGTSVISMLEPASEAIVRLLQHTERAGARVVNVRREAEQRFDEEMQARLSGSVWLSCHNWYHEDGGRISTQWPGRAEEYQKRCRDLDLDDFEVA